VNGTLSSGNGVRVSGDLADKAAALDFIETLVNDDPDL